MRKNAPVQILSGSSCDQKFGVNCARQNFVPRWAQIFLHQNHLLGSQLIISLRICNCWKLLLGKYLLLLLGVYLLLLGVGLLLCVYLLLLLLWHPVSLTTDHLGSVKLLLLLGALDLLHGLSRLVGLLLKGERKSCLACPVTPLPSAFIRWPHSSCTCTKLEKLNWGFSCNWI